MIENIWYIFGFGKGFKKYRKRLYKCIFINHSFPPQQPRPLYEFAGNKNKSSEWWGIPPRLKKFCKKYSLKAVGVIPENEKENYIIAKERTIHVRRRFTTEYSIRNSNKKLFFKYCEAKLITTLKREINYLLKERKKTKGYKPEIWIEFYSDSVSFESTLMICNMIDYIIFPLIPFEMVKLYIVIPKTSKK